MRILICSDSHGNNELLDKIIKDNPNIDYYLHAGDSESSELSIMPFLSVKGNCDYFTDAPEQRIIATPYGKLLMRHEPYLPSGIVSKENIKIFIHGHTHRKRNDKVGNLLIINPGSVSLPRDSDFGTYAILDIEKENVTVRFITLK